MKTLFRIIIIVVIIAAVAFLAKNIIAKTAIEQGAQMVTGLKLRMDSFNLSFTKNNVGMKELRLYNPKGYADKIMVDIPTIYVDYKIAPLLKGKVHLEEMVFHLKELTVVKNKEGELNLDALKPVKKEEAAAEKKEPKKVEKKEPGKALQFQIDKMVLRIGKVQFKDYSQGGEPSVKTFNINIDETIYGVDDPAVLVNLILFKALTGTTIGRLADFDMNGLQDSVSGTLDASKERAGELAKQSKEMAAAKAKEVEKLASEKADELADKTKRSIGDLKDKFKF
jgi:uncharacterized protein involved in outer membrane biogenesis